MLVVIGGPALREKESRPCNVRGFKKQTAQHSQSAEELLGFSVATLCCSLRTWGLEPKSREQKGEGDNSFLSPGSTHITVFCCALGKYNCGLTLTHRFEREKKKKMMVAAAAFNAARK